MPYKRVWVDPEHVLAHKGVNIYRVYKDDNFDMNMLYWFTNHKMFTQDNNCEEFDVRNLLEKLIDSGHIMKGFLIEKFDGDTWKGENLDNKKHVLRVAIEQGLIK